MKLDWKRIAPVALVVGVTGWFALIAVGLGGVGAHVWMFEKRQKQPIHFPHATHITKVGLQCVKCHTTVDKSPQAGAPPLSVCMECHNKVKLDSPDIKILTDHWQKQQPIEWEKIHRVPWHVRFNHKRHIAAGVDCAICHGEVKTMMQVHQVRSLEMGWCVRCHQQNNASTDCWTCHK
jgi:hypothetical protein